ncbi:hypothetical protein DFH11DRAFT_179567 [Phellopilus nigrolimitatus]|nr:hypothetical protein DFH11DRAFT_179567 [Phellopilus nigrolimitatus]
MLVQYTPCRCLQMRLYSAQCQAKRNTQSACNEPCRARLHSTLLPNGPSTRTFCLGPWRRAVLSLSRLPRERYLRYTQGVLSAPAYHYFVLLGLVLWRWLLSSTSMASGSSFSIAIHWIVQLRAACCVRRPACSSCPSLSLVLRGLVLYVRTYRKPGVQGFALALFRDS